MPKKRIKLGRKYAVLAFIFAAVVMLVAAEVGVRKSVVNASAVQAEGVITAQINSSVYAVIKENNITYSDLVHSYCNSQGEMEYAGFDMSRINVLKAEILTRIKNEKKLTDGCEISVPMGNLTQSLVFNGKGPKIKVKTGLYSAVNIEISSSLSEVGINQALHKIILTVNAKFYTYIPGGNTVKSISTSYCLAETLIIGDVPSAFTLIEETPSDTADLVNDYAATE